MTVPLKLKDSAAPTELQVFSSTEENYLAYLAGQHMAGYANGTPGTLSTTNTGNLVGTLTDTSFDSAVGTGGGGSLLTIGTTTTSLYQAAGSISDATIRSSSDFRLPVMQRDSDNGQRVIREMNDSDMDSLITRIRSRVFTSDYPSTYRLGSSTPTGSWTTSISNLATDTRTDGTSVGYNIYRKTNDTSPTKVLPFSIKRASGSTGAYGGLQLMTDQQVRQTFADYLRNKIASEVSSNGIGSYKIYPSGTTPTGQGLPGTWAAKGTATDTRQVVSDVNYTRARSSTYSKLRTSTYSAAYARTRSSTFLNHTDATRTSSYTTTRTTDRTDHYAASGFLGNYTGDFTGNTERVYSRNRSSALNYQGNYTQNFTAAYSRLSVFTGNYADAEGNNFIRQSNVVNNYTGNYGNTFTGNYGRINVYSGNYTGEYTRNSTRDSQSIDDANYARNFEGNYARNFDRNRESNYTRNSTADYFRISTRDSNRDSNRTITGDFTGDFTGNYTRNYARDFTRTSIQTTNYTAVYQRGRHKLGNVTYYTGDFIGQRYYTRQRQNYAYGWTGYYYSRSNSTTDDYWRVIYGGPSHVNGDQYGISVFAKIYASSADGSGASLQIGATDAVTNGLDDPSSVFPFEDYLTITSYNYSNTIPSYEDFVGGTWANFITKMKLITGMIIGVYEYERGSFQGRYHSNLYNDYPDADFPYWDYYSVRRRSAAYFTGNFAASYIGEYQNTFARAFTRNSTVNSTTEYAGDYAGDFAGDYTGDFVGDFTGDYTRFFSGQYSRNYVSTRSSNYSGGDSYSRTFTGNFIGNFTRTFTANYIGNYSRNYAGNYTGNYLRNFQGNFARTFTGNYAGQTIGSGNQNIETYTLYVRTA